MALSARNQLKGRITKITLGDIMVHVVVKIGKHTIESVITRQSAEHMKLKKGDTVEARSGFPWRYAKFHSFQTSYFVASR